MINVIGYFVTLILSIVYTKIISNVGESLFPDGPLPTGVFILFTLFTLCSIYFVATALFSPTQERIEMLILAIVISIIGMVVISPAIGHLWFSLLLTPLAIGFSYISFHILLRPKLLDKIIKFVIYISFLPVILVMSILFMFMSTSVAPKSVSVLLSEILALLDDL